MPTIANDTTLNRDRTQSRVECAAAVELDAVVDVPGNQFNNLKDFRAENGSSQGQNLVLADTFWPNSLDMGR
jgi:hypothetical protein